MNLSLAWDLQAARISAGGARVDQQGGGVLERGFKREEK